MVPLEGIEPPLLSERDFESRASTNSATGATDAYPCPGRIAKQMGFASHRYAHALATRVPSLAS